MSGPLAGCRVVEIAGLGPGPFAAMMLADMGADVIRVDRKSAAAGGAAAGGAAAAPPLDLLARGRRSVGVDLKQPGGAELVLRLAGQADALIEGFRPGVAERLGIGPAECLERNPRLVYGRMTGWGQDGPWAGAAGHDINYIALAGALAAIGRAGEPPVPPLNLVGDFGGGGMLLAFGITCGLLEAARSGQGQVVDAAMIDGAALLMTMMHGLAAGGSWRPERGTNLLDSGAPFYDVYETADGGYVSVGSLEPQFYAQLLRITGLAAEDLPAQLDRSQWPSLRKRLAEVFRGKTRDEWCALMEGTDVCFAPVLSMDEAPGHPHNAARGTFTEVAGVRQAAPAPRFSRTPGAISRPPAHPGQHTEEALRDWGFSPDELTSLAAAGVIAA
jgi:alpha-methylacyl-CoA racemase